MNRIIITEIGDSIRRDMKEELGSDYNFISNKKSLRLNTNASESTAELRRQNTINPLLCQQELSSVAKSKLYKMAKLSLQGQAQQLKFSIQEDLNLPKESTFFNRNLDKVVHKIVDNQDQFTKRKSQLLKQLMLMKQNDRSKSNYNLALRDNEQMQANMQVKKIINAEGKLEQLQRRFQRQSQADLRIRQRLASCLEQNQERTSSLYKVDLQAMSMVIKKKEIIQKDGSLTRMRIRVSCNKNTNTD